MLNLYSSYSSCLWHAFLCSNVICLSSVLLLSLHHDHLLCLSMGILNKTWLSNNCLFSSSISKILRFYILAILYTSAWADFTNLISHHTRVIITVILLRLWYVVVIGSHKSPVWLYFSLTTSPSFHPCFAICIRCNDWKKSSTFVLYWTNL